VIRVKKKGNERYFYDNDNQLTFYVIGKGYVDIYTKECNTLRIYQNDFNIFGQRKVLEFIKQHFSEELANKIFIYVLKDLVYEVRVSE